MSQTQQTITHIAADLFQRVGYTETTLDTIAENAAILTTELETDYSSKEHITLNLYRELAEQTKSDIENLPDGKVSQRYFKVMEGKISQLEPYYEAVAALFAYAMLPHSDITSRDISPGKRDPMYQAFCLLIEGSEDAPAGEGDVENLVMLLYTFHFLILLFWVYDRTDEKQATHYLIDFMGDFFKVMRPMLVMPLFSKAMTKLAQIMMLVFGGARIVEPDSES